MRYLKLSLIAGLALASTTGCQNQAGAPTSPFLAADRVPPPATRNLAPGTAVPYYPATPQPALPAGAAAPTPAMNPLANAATPSRIPVTGVPIALPTDNQPLRMAATNQLAITDLGPAIAPAAQPPVAAPEFTPPPQDATLAWGAGVPPVPMTTEPFLPQPAVQAAYSSSPTPRVRLPGYAAPAVYTAPAQPRMGQVQVTELPPQSYAPIQPELAGGDGFKARGASGAMY